MNNSDLINNFNKLTDDIRDKIGNYIESNRLYANSDGINGIGDYYVNIDQSKVDINLSYDTDEDLLPVCIKCDGVILQTISINKDFPNSIYPDDLINYYVNAV